MSTLPLAYFGFDAAEPLLVRQGIDEGWLPTMAGLLEAGRYASLSPVPSGFYNTSWASTVTGTDVQGHAAILDRVLEPGTYRIVDLAASAFGRKPFWRYLSEAGLRSTLVSVYSSSFLPSFNGTQVQGWGSIDPYSAKFEDTSFDPPEVEDLLHRAVGRRQALYRLAFPRSSFEVRRYRDRLLRSIDEQTRGLAALIDGTEWDFFFGSYAEPHQAGHLLWHLTDPLHPDYDPDADADLRDALPAIYRAVDTGLGLLLGRLPPECRAFVLTPHGMGPNYVQDPVEPLLELGGWFVRRPAISTGGLRDRSVRAAWALGRRAVPVRSRLRLLVARTRMGSDERATMPLSHVDWSQTQAFGAPQRHDLVRANQPRGARAGGNCQAGRRVRPSLRRSVRRSCVGDRRRYGTSRRGTRRPLRRALGRPIGGFLPDVCVVWADGSLMRRFQLPGHGTIEGPRTDLRTGQHRHLGFMLGAGDGIAQSEEQTTGTILDIAPTALALLGVDPPPELPGRPIEAFTRA